MSIPTAVLEVAVGRTDSAVLPEQPVHSVSVENLTSWPLVVRVVSVPGAHALLLVVEAGPVLLSRVPPESMVPQN